MAKKIEPSDISEQLDFDIFEAREFAGDLLEDVNDHQVAYAIRSMTAGDPDLACAFLMLGYELEQAGELTPALRREQNKLLDRFNELR